MFDKIMNHPELLRCVTVISNAYVQIPVGQNIKTFTATLQSVLHLNCSWRLENNETSNKAVSLPLYLCRTWCQDINLHLYYFLCFVYSPNSVQQLGPDILALEVQPYSLPLSDGEMGGGVKYGYYGDENDGIFGRISGRSWLTLYLMRTVSSA